MAVDDRGDQVLKKAAIVLDGGTQNHTDKGSEYVIRVLDEVVKNVLDDILAALGGTSSNNTTKTVFNIALGAANTEQSQSLPDDTVAYIIKTRGNSELKLAWSATESGTKFITIKKNASFEDQNFSTSLTLYFQSPQTSDIVEIVAWSI